MPSRLPRSHRWQGAEKPLACTSLRAIAYLVTRLSRSLKLHRFCTGDPRFSSTRIYPKCSASTIPAIGSWLCRRSTPDRFLNVSRRTFGSHFAQRLLNPLRRSGCICYGGYRHRRAGIHACLGCRGSSMGLHPIRGERGERLRGSLPAKISWRRHDVGGGRGLTGRAGGKGPDVGATGAEVRKALEQDPSGKRLRQARPTIGGYLRRGRGFAAAVWARARPSAQAISGIPDDRGGAETRRLLASYANGAPGALLTMAAEAALKR
jgi:hypothetical protein